MFETSHHNEVMVVLLEDRRKLGKECPRQFISITMGDPYAQEFVTAMDPTKVWGLRAVVAWRPEFIDNFLGTFREAYQVFVDFLRQEIPQLDEYCYLVPHDDMHVEVQNLYPFLLSEKGIKNDWEMQKHLMGDWLRLLKDTISPDQRRDCLLPEREQETRNMGSLLYHDNPTLDALRDAIDQAGKAARVQPAFLQSGIKYIRQNTRPLHAEIIFMRFLKAPPDVDQFSAQYWKAISDFEKVYPQNPLFHIPLKMHSMTVVEETIAHMHVVGGGVSPNALHTFEFPDDGRVQSIDKKPSALKSEYSGYDKKQQDTDKQLEEELQAAEGSQGGEKQK